MVRRQPMEFTKNSLRPSGPRFDFRPPDDVRWDLKSSYILRRYQSLKAEALAATGLDKPVDQEDIRSVLLALAPPQPTHAGPRIRLAREGGELSLSKHRFSNATTVVFGAESSALLRIRELSQSLERELGLEQPDALTFLLTDQPILLPWIVIESDLDHVSGGSFLIRVASAQIAAEDIREAYVTARREALGVQPPRQIKVDDLSIYLHESDSRAAGLTWEQTWEAWKTEAEQLGANPYSDWRAYRNKVDDLKKRFAWLREDLDSMPKRPTGRPRRGGESNDKTE